MQMTNDILLVGIGMLAFFLMSFFIKEFPPGYGYTERARNEKICWFLFILGIAFIGTGIFLDPAYV